MKSHVLVGKVVTVIYLAADKQALRFDVEGGDPIVARCDGDCCSYTWVEHIENPEAIIGAEIVSAENISMPDLGEMPGREVVAYYGFKIETAKGTCVIDYRNDSNGYYGGSLEWPDSRCYYGGVHGQNVSKEEWREVTP